MPPDHFLQWCSSGSDATFSQGAEISAMVQSVQSLEKVKLKM
jgi:hypothetical protein